MFAKLCNISHRVLHSDDRSCAAELLRCVPAVHLNPCNLPNLAFLACI